MKKTFSILLIGVLIFSIVGYEIIFSLMLYQIKEDGENIIKPGRKVENEVVLVINSVNKNLLHRHNRHEVEFKGVMYDIRKEEHKGNDLILHAVMDVNEQNLVNVFRLENKEDHSGKHSKARINNKDFSRIYLISFASKKFSRNITSKIVMFSITEYNQPDKILFTPPPQPFMV